MRKLKKADYWYFQRVFITNLYFSRTTVKNNVYLPKVCLHYITNKMAHPITFDTLAYAKKLIAVCFTQQQTEVQTEALIEIVDEHLTTVKSH